MTKTHRIALYPGDGIGAEVTAATVSLLESLTAAGGPRLAFTRFPWGADYHRTHGEVAPADFLTQLRPHDAVFLGAVGWPASLPDHVTLKPLITMRQAWDLFACVRPARTFPGVRSLLAAQPAVDMVVVRENSEGEYCDVGGRFHASAPEEFALQTAVHSRRGVERILRHAATLAATLRGRLTVATKSNAQRHAFTLWEEILAEVARDFPAVEFRSQHIDALSMDFVRRPEAFDVVVASNLFGDILTDLSGAITGGLGLNPSANLDPTRTYPSLFEPVHGSAPDIAGRGIANPTGAMLAAAMMLAWLDEAPAARRLEAAVEATLAAGETTPDLGGSLDTASFTRAVIRRL